MNKLEVATKHIFFKLFFLSQIHASLLYASEVWGLLVTDDDIEKVHTYACKQFLIGRSPISKKEFSFKVRVHFWKALK